MLEKVRRCVLLDVDSGRKEARRRAVDSDFPELEPERNSSRPQITSNNVATRRFILLLPHLQKLCFVRERAR